MPDSADWFAARGLPLPDLPEGYWWEYAEIQAHPVDLEADAARMARMRRDAVFICDQFNVPPHVIIAEYPYHPHTWKLRRYLRRWRRWVGQNLRP